ncbi:hypothetical protein HPP92_008498 [Vanilla planifolia]|uniref:Pollen Ole e 1 allergen and extensin family protein n=1 Tax=Vanilla planifolia TaxID=51239 RepID=A0A835V210_VANPL|nr:hypothetical protein HPP92_008498 [Vanilla planifolia]
MGRTPSAGMLLFLALALLVSAAAGELTWKRKDSKNVHITGKVMCQDCSMGWTQWANGAKPLKGSRVAVTCMDARRHVVYYGSDETDAKGEFDLEVELSRRSDGGVSSAAKEIDPKGCAVRLVSSPDDDCGVMTDFGGGRKGVRLTRPSHVYPGVLRYTVGPFFFTSPMCDEPDTSTGGGAPPRGGY